MRWIGVVFMIFGNDPVAGQLVRMDMINDCMVRLNVSVVNGETGMFASGIELAVPFPGMSESYPGIGICAYPSFFLYLPGECLNKVTPFDEPWISLACSVSMAPFVLLPGTYRMFEKNGNACVILDMEMK